MAGIITGSCDLIDRYNYGNGAKVMPVDATTLKSHIQLTHNLDDDLVTGVGGYLPAATEDVEERANMAFIKQKRKQWIGADVLPRLSGTSVELVFGPVIGLVEVKYLDSNEAEQTMPATNYRLTGNEIYFKGSLPTLAEGPGTVWVVYEAGYGTAPSSVPARWQSIIMQVAMRKYEYRMVAANLVNSGDEAYEKMLDRLIVAAGGSRRG